MIQKDELATTFAVMVGATLRFWAVVVKQIARKVRGELSARDGARERVD